MSHMARALQVPDLDFILHGSGLPHVRVTRSQPQPAYRHEACLGESAQRASVLRVVARPVEGRTCGQPQPSRAENDLQPCPVGVSNTLGQIRPPRDVAEGACIARIYTPVAALPASIGMRLRTSVRAYHEARSGR